VSDFYIVSVKHTRRDNLYITVWRPNDCGYAWPLSWAGKYDEARIKELPGYYHNGHSSIAVPCEVIDELAVPVIPGTVDNDAGPVVMNSRGNWQRILKAMLWPPADQPKPKYKIERRQKGTPPHGR
jgi:hypothetical protein